MTIDNAANYIGTLTPDTNALSLWGGKWYVPSKPWRKLCGEFGESMVRTIVGNSSRGFSPDLSEEHASIIHKVCEKAKAEV